MPLAAKHGRIAAWRHERKPWRHDGKDGGKAWRHGGKTCGINAS
eukprot:gene16680-biopygen327